MSEIVIPRHEVRRLHHVISKRMAKAEADMTALRSACSHLVTTDKHCSSTGYAEPTIYWTERRCVDCGKYWSDYK